MTTIRDEVDTARANDLRHADTAHVDILMDRLQEALDRIEALEKKAIEHEIGNPVFAIETNLSPLRKRIAENRVDEALQIVDEIEVSLERIKTVVKGP